MWENMDLYLYIQTFNFLEKGKYVVFDAVDHNLQLEIRISKLWNYLIRLSSLYRQWQSKGALNSWDWEEDFQIS